VAEQDNSPIRLHSVGQLNFNPGYGLTTVLVAMGMSVGVLFVQLATS
jgi:hypothetical protein